MCLFAQGAYTPPNADYSFPRTMLQNEDLADVQASLADPVKQSAYAQIWNMAKQNPPTSNSSDSDRTVRSQIAKEAAFVYYMKRKYHSGNDNIVVLSAFDSLKYLDRSRDLLNSINPAVGYISNSYIFYDEWQIRTKELINYLIAYDLLLGSGLDPADLATAKSLLHEFAGNHCMRALDSYSVPFLPDLQFYPVNPNNHGVMMSGALGLAAIVLNDVTSTDTNFQPQQWMNVAMWNFDHLLFRNDTNVPRVSEPDVIAGYAEGPNYFWYGFQNAFPFIRAMWNFLPDGTYDYTYEGETRSIRHPWYDQNIHNLYDWVKRIRMPNGTNPAIHDSKIEQGWAGSVLSLTGYPEYNIPNAFGYNSFHIRSQFIATNTPYSDYDEALFQALPISGDLVFRSAYNDPSATYMHLIGKHGTALYGAKAHHQADATSFELYFNGEVLALDSGYAGSAYSSNTNKATDHNLILVDGSGPGAPSSEWVNSNNEAYIENYFDGDFIDYGEIRSSWRNANMIRKTLFLNDSYFVIADFIESTGSHDYTFQLHGKGLVGADANSGEGNCTPDFTNNRVVYKRGDSELLGHIQARGGASNYSTVSDEYAKGGNNSYRDYSKTLVQKNNVSNTEFLSLLYPYESANAPMVNELAINDQVNAIEVNGTTSTEIIFTQANQEVVNIPAAVSSLGGNVQADGLYNVFSVDNNEEFRMAFMEDGTYFSFKGTPILSTDTRMDVSISKTGEGTFSGYASSPGEIYFYTDEPLVATSGILEFVNYDFGRNRAILYVSEAGSFELALGMPQCSKPVGDWIKYFPEDFSNVTLKWDAMIDAEKYKIRYRKVGTTNWNVSYRVDTKKTFNPLEPSTDYEYQLKAKCSGSYTTWTSKTVFTTLANLNPSGFSNLHYESSSGINVYPNPATDHLIFDTGNQLIDFAEIYHINGQLKQRIAAFDKEKRIDLNNLSNGVYYITYKTSGEINTKKFIIAR